MAPLLEVGATRADPSRVVIVSSTAGTTVQHIGDHGTIMYSVSKAAAHHLARNLAMELGPRNITTNTVAPGFFPSKLANGLIDILGGEQELKDSNPRRRLGEPEDIAGVMIFLCSPAGSYMYVLFFKIQVQSDLMECSNGEDISVDGGMRLVTGRHSKI
jgi:NAD(P)-dependent dehydrogenase (short-subunit alcohol dehydrogenase family)